MFSRKGQNIAEYSILIALVITAAVTMQVYLRRGLSARQADAIDFSPNIQVAPGVFLKQNRTQYEPYYVDSNANIRQTKSYQEDITERGGITRSGITESTTKERDAYERIEWEGFNAQ